MKKKIDILNSVLFTTVTITGGIIFWVMPQQTVSTDENRELKKQPVATMESVFSGKYGKDFEEFYNDHFPWRNDWMEVASQIDTVKGIKNQEFRVINTPTEQAAPAAPTAQSAEKVDINKAIAEEEALEAEFSKVRGVIVVNGRVVQNFAGSKATISPFADMLNTYRNTLPATVTMYAMMIPAGSDYYLPKQVNNGVKKEKESIDLFNTLIDPRIIPVPAYEETWPHKNEYIMFRTDHHWTGLGAYYAYRAFATSAGMTPLELSQMQHVTTEGTFLGSLFNYTKDQELKKNPDTLDYYKIPGDYTVTIYPKSNPKGIPGQLLVENSKSYGVFLGGDWPLTHIKNNQPQNNKKLLVVKDSFGNALSTYLGYHYSDVYVIDYRHFKGNIPQFIAENGITDFLYAHNTFAANSKAVVKYGMQMLKN